MKVSLGAMLLNNRNSQHTYRVLTYLRNNVKSARQVWRALKNRAVGKLGASNLRYPNNFQVLENGSHLVREYMAQVQFELHLCLKISGRRDLCSVTIFVSDRIVSDYVPFLGTDILTPYRLC
jgi:hypothetical protein